MLGILCLEVITLIAMLSVMAAWIFIRRVYPDRQRHWWERTLRSVFVILFLAAMTLFFISITSIVY